MLKEIKEWLEKAAQLEDKEAVKLLEKAKEKAEDLQKKEMREGNWELVAEIQQITAELNQQLQGKCGKLGRAACPYWPHEDVLSVHVNRFRYAVSYFRLGASANDVDCRKGLDHLYTYGVYLINEKEAAANRLMIDKTDLETRILTITDLDVIMANIDSRNFSAAGFSFLDKEYEKCYELFQKVLEECPGEEALAGLCRYNMGILLENGYLGAPDYKGAYEHYWAAALAGVRNAKYHLAKMLYFGKPGVPKDPDRAFELAEMALQDGVKPAQEILANCYLMGVGVEKNSEKASKLRVELMDHYIGLVNILKNAPKIKSRHPDWDE